ncbi:MAG: YitT family protein [Lachnospiraceae bacterium]|nr:YitT family protein [Lachnospiraceae bacterium]
MPERLSFDKKSLLYIGGIVLGSFIYAAGVALFLDPNNLAPGGLIGIAVILNRLVSIDTGTLYFILNIPIVLLGWWKFGGKFIASTFFAILINSVMTNKLAEFPPITTDPLLAALAGSILVGVGIAIVFQCGATTGGTDIIVKVLRTKYKHLKTGFLFLMTDIVIVSISGLVFRDFNIVLYAFIAVTVSGKAMDYMLYGSDEAKLIYIISNEAERIAARILKDMDIGATYLSGQGAYTGTDKKVIMCVVQKKRAPELEDIVKHEDKDAFMIVSSANEIYGEGYKNILHEKI